MNEIVISNIRIAVSGAVGTAIAWADTEFGVVLDDADSTLVTGAAINEQEPGVPPRDPVANSQLQTTERKAHGEQQVRFRERALFAYIDQRELLLGEQPRVHLLRRDSLNRHPRTNPSRPRTPSHQRQPE